MSDARSQRDNRYRLPLQKLAVNAMARAPSQVRGLCLRTFNKPVKGDIPVIGPLHTATA
jgi:hypothetical protein